MKKEIRCDCKKKSESNCKMFELIVSFLSSLFFYGLLIFSSIHTFAIFYALSLKITTPPLIAMIMVSTIVITMFFSYLFFESVITFQRDIKKIKGGE